MKHRVAITIHAAVLVLASVAAAQTESPEQLYQRGITTQQQGHDEESIELFRRAWDAGHEPRALVHLGFAEQAVGRWVAAEAHLREAIQQHADDTWVRQHRPALDSAYAVVQQHVGSLEVLGGVLGARVNLNGTDIGTLPMTAPVFIEAGATSIIVTADGFEAVRRDLHVLPGQLNREQIDMTVRHFDESTSLDHRDSLRRRRGSAIPGAIVAGSGGIAALVVGVTTVALSWERNVPADCNVNQTPWTCPTQADVDQVNGSETRTYIGYAILGIGTGITAVGVIVAVASASRGSVADAAPPRVAVSLQVTPSARGVALEGRF